MGKEEFVKDFYGRLIGSTEVKPNGDIVVRNFPGKQILGYYRARDNVTTDFFGRIISQGNTAIGLLNIKR